MLVGKSKVFLLHHFDGKKLNIDKELIVLCLYQVS